MGLAHVTTQVRNLACSGTPYEADFMVDTGAVDCLGPADRLRAAGIRPEAKAVYELANGEPVEYEYGFARVALMGQETVVQIIFGPDDAEPILGVVALENMGVTVDPITRTLLRLHAKPLKHLG
jgi:predicted aspartyl protease